MGGPFHRRGRVRSLGWSCCALIVLTISGGCATKRDRISQALASSAPAPTIHSASIQESYRIAYPDAIEVTVEGMPQYSGRFVMNVEGRIDVPGLESPRIDGETAASIQRQFAQELDLTVDQVQCRVIAHRSRMIYVRGPIEGGDQAVPYQGPENVVSFIRRCGGLHTSANVKDIHVVRSNVPLATRPQVFAVDLEAILLRGDPKTNILLQSFDEIYIGELSRAKLGRALPDWLKPIYRGFCGVLPGFCPHDWRQQIRDPSP